MSTLSLLRSRLTVGIDQLNPDLAEKYGPFGDMILMGTASNPVVLAALIASDTHVDIVRRTVARARLETDGNVEAAVELALDLLIITLAKATLPHLNGRVHAQISPRHAYSVSSTLKHAHHLMRLFAQEGISPGRVCLQIPCTGPGMVAAAELEKSGIAISATIVACLPQAHAAAQAGCMYVAPHLNGMNALFQPGTWMAYNDTAREHPMAVVIRDIVGEYKQRGGHTPDIMVMGLITAAEATAASTLGVGHLSLGGKVIEELAAGRKDAKYRPEVLEEDEAMVKPVDPMSEEGEDVDMDDQIDPGGKSRQPDVDWLENEGEALDAAIKADESASRRLEYDIRAYLESESRVGQVIRMMLALP